MVMASTELVAICGLIGLAVVVFVVLLLRFIFGGRGQQQQQQQQQQQTVVINTGNVPTVVESNQSPLETEENE
tara:strand:- start:1296 stop:1514 length:219 start_codon:yes stop_codon:yes gene_type:complete